MARQEQDREDLLSEATALVERVELLIAEKQPPVVAGFRRGSELSLYFDQDPALHFNAAGQLRRAYLDGLLFKAEQGQWVGLARQRTSDAVVLVRQTLAGGPLAEMLSKLEDRLGKLQEDLGAGRYRVLRQVPDDRPVVARLLVWLTDRPRPLAIAQSPRVR